MVSVGTAPTLDLPERLDRTLRLGPFRSGRQALKFVTYLAVGALLVPFLGPWIWIPFTGAGISVAFWRPGGEAIDERVVRFARWKWRQVGEGGAMNLSGAPDRGRRSMVRLPGSFATVVRTGGVPLAYLPSPELARRFEQYRDLLRSIDASFVVLCTRAPIHPASFVPAEPTPVGPEGVARRGYRELVEVIVRRRQIRQVYIGLATAGSDSEAIGRLETQTASLIERLRALGVRPLRLRDRALGEAARRMGISEGGADR
ncbi:MAG: hypothetical protein WBG19_06130 [Thermoplasmata archaeon]